MSSPVKAATVMRKLNILRDACRQEGTPAIQDAWDAIEDYLAHLFRAGTAVEKDAE